MAAIPRPQRLLLPLLLPLCLLFSLASAAGRPASDLRVIHAYGPSSPFRQSSSPSSWVDTLLDLESRDKSRLAYLSSLVAAPARTRRSWAPVASGMKILQYANYVVRISLGTPAQPLLLALDTSNDAAWVPCSSCSGCPAFTPFSYDRSATFGPVGCSEPQCKQVPGSPLCSRSNTCGFNMTYGSSTFEAALSKDTLNIAGDDFPGYTFGCLTKTTGSSVPPQGLLGLGRGPLSLLSQTKARYSSTFSYCLPALRSLNFSGSLRLGPRGQPVRIKYTPLLTNPHRPSLYYVSLTGIRVGRRVVAIPPSALAFDPTTGAGTILDSGTMFTRLVAPAYVALRDEFRRRVGGNATSLGGFDTCYDGPTPRPFPAVTLLFAGMNVTLPEENLIIRSTAGSTACLAMAAAPGNVNSVLNVIANMQQQNHRVVFDAPNARVGVAREHCTAL